MPDDVDLDAIFDRFHKPDIKIFKNRDVLRATYVPDSLPHRNKEIKELAEKLGPIMGGGTPSNIFVYGKPGTGKTAVTKYVLGFLEEKADSVNISVSHSYINCQMVDTTYRVYVALCDAIGVDVPPTGLPTDEVMNQFNAALDELGEKLVIVFDEIDLLLEKTTKPLYNLTRLNTDLTSARVSVIGITNSTTFKDKIDARVRSTLTEQELVFNPYTADQLRDILIERSRMGFEDGVVEEGAISRAAAIAAKEHGDARRALDLLRVAGEVAENTGSETVSDEHVGKAGEVIEKNTVKEVLQGLPTHSKIVLVAITILNIEKRGSKEFTSTGDVYDMYVKLTGKMHQEPLTQRRVGDLINELDVLGMIQANVVSKGRYGRTRQITVAVHIMEIYNVLKSDSLISEILPSEEFWFNG